MSTFRHKSETSQLKQIGITNLDLNRRYTPAKKIRQSQTPKGQLERLHARKFREAWRENIVQQMPEELKERALVGFKNWRQKVPFPPRKCPVCTSAQMDEISRLLLFSPNDYEDLAKRFHIRSLDLHSHMHSHMRTFFPTVLGLEVVQLLDNLLKNCRFPYKMETTRQLGWIIAQLDYVRQALLENMVVPQGLSIDAINCFLAIIMKQRDTAMLKWRIESAEKGVRIGRPPYKKALEKEREEKERTLDRVVEESVMEKIVAAQSRRKEAKNGRTGAGTDEPADESSPTTGED